MQLTFDCFDVENRNSFQADIDFEPNEKLQDVLKKNFPNYTNGHFGYKDKSKPFINVDYYFDNGGILHWDENIEEMIMENILRRYPDINKEVEIVFNIGGIGYVNAIQFVVEMMQKFDVWASTHPVELIFLQGILQARYNQIKSKIKQYFETIDCNQTSSFENSILSREAWTWNEVTTALQTENEEVIIPLMMENGFSYDEKIKVFYLNKEPKNK